MKKKNVFIHSSSFIDKGAIIGSGTKIWHNCHITETAMIGENCNVGQNCYVAGVMGNYCKLQNNINLYQGVRLGNYVFCGPSMTFTNDLNPRVEYPKNNKWLETVVWDGVSFGAGAVVICGITIGKYAFIGAGAVVTKSIPDYGLVYGNPAKLKGWMCECGQKIPLKFSKYSCSGCQRSYLQEKQIVKKIK